MSQSLRRLAVRGCAMVTACLLCAACNANPAPSPSPSPSPSGQAIQPGTQTPNALPSPSPSWNPSDAAALTGLNGQASYRPIAVMIDNEATARPARGLSLADIVYEAYVEADITRYMALFSDNMPTEVGPVRSARVYFVGLALQYRAGFVHFGAAMDNNAANAEQMLKDNPPLFRIDGLSGASEIYRDSSRKSPHNAFINLQKLAQAKNPSSEPYQMKFNPDAAYAGSDVLAFSLQYNDSNKVSYQYDAQKKTYTRSINGSVQRDELTGEAIAPSNVVVQYAAMQTLSTGHKLFALTGEGKAEFFIGGKHIEGTWKDDSIHSRTVFYDQDGRELAFQPGRTWIQILPVNKKVTLS